MATAPLLKAVLPGLAEELKLGLQREGEHDLAAQVDSIAVVERCGCDEFACGTFHTVRLPPRGSFGRNHDSLELEGAPGLVVVDVAEGVRDSDGNDVANYGRLTIVGVEVLYRNDVRDALIAAGVPARPTTNR